MRLEKKNFNETHVGYYLERRIKFAPRIVMKRTLDPEDTVYVIHQTPIPLRPLGTPRATSISLYYGVCEDNRVVTIDPKDSEGRTTTLLGDCQDMT